MKRVFFGIFLLMFSFTAAAQLSTSGLTKEQVADMEALIAATKAENVKKGGKDIVEAAKDPETMKQYAEVGEAIAKSLGAAAKEMGIAVNDFMGTPAGMLTVLLIVYHFIGGDLISIAVCSFLIPVLIWAHVRYVRWIRVEKIEYDEKGKKRFIPYPRVTEERAWALIVPTLALFGTIVTLVIIMLPG